MKKLAIEAAREGGRVLMQKFGTVLSISHKGEVDLVTEADRAAEEAIVSVIRNTFPRHDILAEEKDHGRSESAYRWIIDPLDGTTNYAHGFPMFAVSIALAVEGEVRMGVVYNPFHHELFFAEKGGGAYLNDVQIRVSSTARLDRALLPPGVP
jgi:myo-inositol-1(or 4)-monophosphatase